MADANSQDPAAAVAQDGPTEETPLFQHPDERESQKHKAMEATFNCPINTLLLILLVSILLMSKDHPGIEDKAEEDKHCQPLILWLTVYTSLTAVGLLVSLAFMWYCCFWPMRCTEIIVSLSQFGVIIWGIVVVLTTHIGKCDPLLFWTSALIVFLGPLMWCCLIMCSMGFAAGFTAAAAMKEEKSPEATPDLAKAAEDAKIVKGNVTAICPVCQEQKLVQFASPCGHMLCEDCRETMQSIEDRENGVKRCPTCRQPVYFFQGVWTAEKPGDQASADV